MAERLTEKNSIENKRYMLNSEDNTVCVTNARLTNCATIAYCWGKPIDKLAQLEDIMEKYGIESVEELSKIFSYLSGRFINSVYGLKHKFDSYEDRIKCLANKKGQYYEELYETKQDRDAWKRACELACEREDDCYVYDNIHRAYEFYQQAKKEKEKN